MGIFSALSDAYDWVVENVNPGDLVIAIGVIASGYDLLVQGYNYIAGNGEPAQTGGPAAAPAASIPFIPWDPISFTPSRPALDPADPQLIWTSSKVQIYNGMPLKLRATSGPPIEGRPSLGGGEPIQSINLLVDYYAVGRAGLTDANLPRDTALQLLPVPMDIGPVVMASLFDLAGVTLDNLPDVDAVYYAFWSAPKPTIDNPTPVGYTNERSGNVSVQTAAIIWEWAPWMGGVQLSVPPPPISRMLGISLIGLPMPSVNPESMPDGGGAAGTTKKGSGGALLALGATGLAVLPFLPGLLKR